MGADSDDFDVESTDLNADRFDKLLSKARRGLGRPQGCAVCDSSPIIGLICDGCRRKLAVADKQQLCQEQILSRTYRSPTPHARVECVGGACIIDPFGRPHPFELDPVVRLQLLIGRSSLSDLSVSHPWVSYRHAAVVYEPTSHRWTLRDLGSRAGVGVGRGALLRAASSQHILDLGEHGATPAFFQIGAFKFVFRSENGPGFARYIEIARQFAAVEFAQAPTQSLRAAVTLTIRKHELLITDASGTDTCLTFGQAPAELAIVRLLEAAWRRDVNVPPETRGFVETQEILDATKYPWDATNVYGVIRNIRRKLTALGFWDLLETRPGGGYRFSLS